MTIRMLKLTVVATGILLFSGMVFANPLLPSQYEGDIYKVRAGTYPSRIVVKRYKPIDKGFSVEIGAPTSSIYEISYDEHHQATCFREYNLEGSLKEQYDRTFNEQGTLKTEQKKGPNRLVQLSNEYVYKNPAQEKTLTSQKIYNPDKKLLYTETYNHDKVGNITRVQRTDASGKALYSYEYEYDSKGNKTKEVRINASGNKVSEDDYEYDDQGNLSVEIRYDANGKVSYQTNYEYDSKGFLSSLTRTVPDGPMETFRFQYEYDAQGNWNKQTVFKGGDVPGIIVVRLIEYR